MQARLTLSLALSSLLLAACSSSSNSPRAVPAPPALNDDGSPVTAVLTARFDPSNRVVPFPTNLFLQGTTDLTLNIPVANPNNFADPTVALNALDGFSTVAPGSTTFSAAPNPATLVPGSSVRVFEVTLTGPGGGVTGIQRELAAPAEFVVALAGSDTTGRTLAIVPTSPLKQLKAYLVVITDDVRDAAGNDATPDQTYFLTKRTSPLCTNGVSTDPLLPNASACALEPLRQLTNSQEIAFSTATGVARSEIVLTWTFSTQGNSPVLTATRSRTGVLPPTTTRLAPTGLTTAIAGLPPIADVFIGTIDLPYYQTAPSAANPTALLTSFWKAAPGAYVPPFNAAGLDPTSTNITTFNPLPVATGTQTVPVLMTVPNAASQRTKPATGWPIVIFQHGITRSRTDMLAISATMAAQGFAVVAIDQPLHGLPPSDALNIERTPFAPIANERTFEVDLVNNTTGAPGPDGVVDASGTHTINLASLLTSRDNLRQAVADLFVLTRDIPTMSNDGDATPDFDGSRIFFVGQSLGSIVGALFVSMEPSVGVSVLSVPGGGIARLLEASPTFGPRIRAGLAASAGLTPGTPAYDSFFGAAQTVIDAADPINYSLVSATDRILLHEVVGGGTVLPDQVIPNSVPGAPLSGTEPMIRHYGLTTITATTQSASGIRGAVRFVVGDHGSLLSPAASAAATVEMQGQMASMIVSGGAAVQVTNSAVIRTQ